MRKTKHSFPDIFIGLHGCLDASTLQSDLNNLHRWEREWLMEFNPEKCFVLNITRKRTPSKNKYSLKNQILQTVKTTTYLGVEISDDLSWSPHISNVTKKEYRSLGFLRRNLVTNNIQVKTQAYTSLVRPHVEYAYSVWDPHKQGDIKRIESVQRRAARYVTNRFHNTSSPSDMIRELEWESLEQRRAKWRLINFYKVIHNMINLTTSNLIPSTSPLLSHSLNFHRPYCATNYLKFSYFSRTIAQWNQLSYSG